jgi:MFS family permease
MLYACMGVGSLVGATIMPKLKKMLSIDKRVALMTLVFAVALLLLGTVTNLLAVLVAMFFIGFSWIIVLSTFNIYVQSVVATWVKARAIGIYILIIQGGIALGSVIWGAIASHYTIPETITLAFAGLVLSLIAILRFPLGIKERLDTQPSLHWPQPVVIHDIDNNHGPVLVSVKYTIDPKNAKEFEKAAKALGPIRRRSGSLRWGIFKDTTNNSHYLETFVTESWGEHLHQHNRLTISDKAIEDRVNAFQKDNKPPEVTHYIAKKML